MMYRVTLTPTEQGNVLAELSDVPGVFSIGKNHEEALAMVLDALLTVCAQQIHDKEPVPTPGARPEPGGPFVELPPVAVAKVAVHNAMLAQGVSQVALAQRLGTDPKSIRRLLNLDYPSRWTQLEAALAVLGLKVRAEVTPLLSAVA